MKHLCILALTVFVSSSAFATTFAGLERTQTVAAVFEKLAESRSLDNMSSLSIALQQDGSAAVQLVNREGEVSEKRFVFSTTRCRVRCSFEAVEAAR